MCICMHAYLYLCANFSNNIIINGSYILLNELKTKTLKSGEYFACN